MRILDVAAGWLSIPVALFLTFSASAVAQSLDAEKLAELNDICTLSPQQCLSLIDDELPKVPEKTHLWYDLQQKKFDALFDLQYSDQLYKETKRWLNIKAPFSFEITVYIYYAKTSIDYEGRETAHKYAQLAKEKLEQMQQAFPSPMRLVELANLHLTLAEYQDAYDLLLSVEKKYRQSKNAHFMMELYGNLAHVTRELKLHHQSLDYWLNTVPWAVAFNNKQQIGTVLYNLATAYAQIEQYDMAESHYIEAIAYSMAAEDKAKTTEAQFQLVNVKIKQQLFEQAQELLDGIDLNFLPSYHQELLLEIQAILRQHSATSKKQ